MIRVYPDPALNSGRSRRKPQAPVTIMAQVYVMSRHHSRDAALRRLVNRSISDMDPLLSELLRWATRLSVVSRRLNSEKSWYPEDHKKRATNIDTIIHVSSMACNQMPFTMFTQ